MRRHFCFFLFKIHSGNFLQFFNGGDDDLRRGVHAEATGIHHKIKAAGSTPFAVGMGFVVGGTDFVGLLDQFFCFAFAASGCPTASPVICIEAKR